MEKKIIALHRKGDAEKMSRKKKMPETENIIADTIEDFAPRDIGEIRIDLSRKKAGRIRSFINQIGDPYHLHYGKAVIDIEYSGNGANLQDIVCELFSDDHETEKKLEERRERY